MENLEKPENKSGISKIKSFLNIGSSSEKAAGQTKESLPSVPSQEQIQRITKESQEQNLNRIGEDSSILREMVNELNERFTRIAEEIGELRTITLETEKEFSGFNLKFDKIDATVKEINPISMLKKMEEVDQHISLVKAENERLSNILKEVRSRFLEVDKLLSNFGGLENVVKMNTSMQEKLFEATELGKKIERFSSKTENIYFEMNKKLENLKKQEDTVNRLEDITKELLKSTDIQKINSKDMVRRDELMDIVREEIKNSVKKSMPETFSILMAELTSWIRFNSDFLNVRIDNLMKERQMIIELVCAVYENYQAGVIPLVDYKEVYADNKLKIDRIDSELVLMRNFLDKVQQIRVGQVVEPLTEELPSKPMYYAVKKEQPVSKIQEEQEEDLPEETKESSPRGKETDTSIEKFSRIKSLSKRENEVLSILWEADATSDLRTFSVNEIAKKMYGSDYNHNKLIYISKIISNLVSEGVLAKAKDGRESKVYVNKGKVTELQGMNKSNKTTKEPSSQKGENDN